MLTQDVLRDRLIADARRFSTKEAGLWTVGRDPLAYASAEEAATGDIPPSQARVVAKCERNGYADRSTST